jgi:dTDP-4-dehydrorhamnose 3,5-epimerase
MTIEQRDVQTVTPDGEIVAAVPHGVRFKDLITQTDDRGTVVELFDTRWDFHGDPLVFAYSFTIRPGWAKGWGMHKEHEDRYFILYGEMELVLYDERPDSPTHGLVSRIILSEHRRRIMNIPRGVWHADRNIGDKDVIVVNFPTICYDHTNPDKYRLPLDNDRIPFKFPEGTKGY